MVAHRYSQEDFKTPAEYLEAERKAETKSEYINGRIYAMALRNRAHNTISLNVVVSLNAQLRSKWFELFAWNMRIKVSETGLYTYPDVFVVCEPLHFEDEQEDTLLNPAVIFEIVAPATEAYDRGEKFAHYRRRQSLTDYIVIAQDQMRIEHFHRQENGDWLLHVVEQPDEILTLASINCQLVVSEVYERVTLPEVPAPPLTQ